MERKKYKTSQRREEIKRKKGIYDPNVIWRGYQVYFLRAEGFYYDTF